MAQVQTTGFKNIVETNQAFKARCKATFHALSLLASVGKERLF
jgi:hypothetical protein